MPFDATFNGHDEELEPPTRETHKKEYAFKYYQQ